MTDPIFKIMTAVEWQGIQEEGVYTGSQDDRKDGFIHLSSASQVRETARRHFAGGKDLVLVWVDESRLGEDMKWEPSRGGALFPHLYGDLHLGAVIRSDPLPLDEDGGHVFPAGLPGESPGP